MFLRSFLIGIFIFLLFGLSRICITGLPFFFWLNWVIDNF
jgi:hypothetical protein